MLPWCVSFLTFSERALDTVGQKAPTFRLKAIAAAHDDCSMPPTFPIFLSCANPYLALQCGFSAAFVPWQRPVAGTGFSFFMNDPDSCGVFGLGPAVDY